MAKISLFVILLLANSSIASECLKLGGTPAKDITKTQILLCEGEALDADNPSYYLVLDSVIRFLFIWNYSQDTSLFNTPALRSSLMKKQLEMLKNRIYWLKKASSSGSMEGLYRLGSVLTYKDHSTKGGEFKHLDEIYDLEGGYNYLLIAANKGHSTAQYYIFEYLMDERLFPNPEPNRKKAFSWLVKSARGDNYLAASKLSHLYLSDKNEVSNMLSMAWHLYALQLMESESYSKSATEALSASYLTERMKIKKDEDYTKSISIGNFILEDIKMGKYDDYGITNYINNFVSEQNKDPEKPDEWGEWSEDDTNL